MYRQYIPSEVPRSKDYETREAWIKALCEYTSKLDPLDAIECLDAEEAA